MSVTPTSPRLTSPLLDVEAALRRIPAEAIAKLGGSGLQGARQLDQRRQAWFAPGSLEQGDLGPVQLAAIAQLFLGDGGLDAGLAEVDCEALLRGHRAEVFAAEDRNSTDKRFPEVGLLSRVRYR